MVGELERGERMMMMMVMLCRQSSQTLCKYHTTTWNLHPIVSELNMRLAWSQNKYIRNEIKRSTHIYRDVAFITIIVLSGGEIYNSYFSGNKIGK